MLINYGINDSVDLSIKNSTDYLHAVGGNAGNLVFIHAIKKIIADSMQSIGWSYDVDYLNKLEASTLVMPCANQLGSHVDMGNVGKVFAGLTNKKIVAIGLGAQHDQLNSFPVLPNGTQEWVKEILKRKNEPHPNIISRGAYSSSLIENYFGKGTSISFGCPSILISQNKNLGATLAQRVKDVPSSIAFLAGHYRWFHLAKFEQAFINELSGYGHFSYVVQQGEDFFRTFFDEPVDDEALRALSQYMFGAGSPPEQAREFIKTHAKIFFNIADWGAHYQACDLVFGMRIHGVVLALQYGIPAVCLAIDSRTLELCQSMCIPYVDIRLVETLKVENITKILREHDWVLFDKLRAEKANVMRDFLLNNHIEPSEHLKSLI